jgi:hypothetical protein
MVLFTLLLLLTLLAVLSIRYGADSRHLAGRDW